MRQLVMDSRKAGIGGTIALCHLLGGAANIVCASPGVTLGSPAKKVVRFLKLIDLWHRQSAGISIG